MENNWFEKWILAPLLAPPSIILDPFTFYYCLLAEDGPDGSLAEDDTTGPTSPSEEP